MNAKEAGRGISGRSRSQNRFFRRKFSKFSESVRTHPKASRCIRMHPNGSEQVRIGPSKPENLEKLTKTSENSRNIREIFANFLRFFCVFPCFLWFPDSLRPIRTCSDPFGCVRMHSEASGTVSTLSEIFEKFLGTERNGGFANVS